MPLGLDLIDGLEEEDIDWLFTAGKERQFGAGEEIIKEGTMPGSIYILQNGSASVTSVVAGGEAIATIGPGDILGEMSFVDGRSASATVTALENTGLLEISWELLRAKIANEAGFATRFYLAITKMISGRLRKTIAKSSNGLSEGANPDSDVEAFWEKARGPLRNFKFLLQDADQASIKKGKIPEDLTQKIRKQFHDVAAGLNILIGDESPLDLHVKEMIGGQLQREILPYLLLTNTGERMYSKPRGYAGDYLTIKRIYENYASGTGRIGALLDRCFLDEPAAKAVRNRRQLLVNEIMNTLHAFPDEPVNVTSLACGPAEEIFDVFSDLEDVSRLNVNVIDIDLQALAFVVDKRDKLGMQRRITPHLGNLLYLATGKQQLNLAPQHLIYSIGLIDYFSDKFVVKLINYGYGLLKPGGRMILGNFHPKNSNKAFMDHILEWRLIHRTEEDMNCLYQKSVFGCAAKSNQFENEGINLFSSCDKAPASD